MGKRPEDLPLSDEPLRRTEPVDVRDTEWYQFSTEILELVSSGQYDWAADTLEGIRESVEQYHTVTPGQRKAIDNIRAARGRADGSRRRRYEGWSRGGR